MKFIAVIFMLLPLNSQAAIWIRSVETSPKEFREFVSQDPDAQTLVQFELGKRRQEEPSAEELRWAQSLLEQSSIEGIHAKVSEYVAADTMTERRRTFLIDLLLKIREKSKGNTKREIDESLCQWSAFPSSSLNYQELPIVCSQMSASLENFRIKNLQFDVVLVEDFEIQMKDGAVAPVNPDKEYTWFLLSNAVGRVSFRGTLKELEQKTLRSEILVKGECDSFTHQIGDLELISNGKVYFNPRCQKELRAPETSHIGKWYEENKPLALTIGIAAIGVIAMGLKNKRVVIEKPSFH